MFTSHTRTLRILIGLATVVAMIGGGAATTLASSPTDNSAANSSDAASTRQDFQTHPPRHRRHHATATISLVIHDAAHNVITAAPAGTSVHASATVSGAAGTPTGTIDFTWYASPDCSTGATPSGAGIALVAGVADPSDSQAALAGGGSYTAQYSGDSAYRAGTSACTPLVVVAPTLASIAVTPADPSILAGTTQQFVATGTYSDASTADLSGLVTWASDTTATATVDGSGLATGVAAGTATISASLGSVSGGTVLTVTAPAPPPPPPAPSLSSIAVTPVLPAVALGTTQQFVATGTYSDNSTADISAQVSWTTSDATIATVDAAGLAHSVGIGTVTIGATLGVLGDSTVLTVDPAALVSIGVTPALPTIAVAATQQFVATGTYTDGTTLDLSAQVTWSSSDATVATIDGTGLATGIGTGASTITATLGAVSGNQLLTVGTLFTVSGQVTQETLDSTGLLSSFLLSDGTIYDVVLAPTTSVVNLLGHEVPRQFIQVANPVTVEGLLTDATTIQAQVVVVQTTKDFP
jgi:uncharacterized protein YjdB